MDLNVNIIKYYCQIRDFTPNLEITEVVKLCRSRQHDVQIETFFKMLHDLNCVTKSLKSKENIVSDACALFDEVILYFPSTWDRFRDNASILLQPYLNRGLQKVQEEPFT